MLERTHPRIEDNFEGRRRIIDTLDITVRLTVEDGQQVAYVSSVLGEDALLVVTTFTWVPERPIELCL